MLVLLFFVFALGRRRVKQGAALTVLLALFGCEGGTPPPDQPPPPAGKSTGTVYYFHNDRLGTPVRLTNEKAVTVWRADYRPFGDVQRLETDVDGDSVHIEQPLHFPGQYDDAMSALILAQGPYYNLNRYFEPGTGRYLSPEPMLQDPMYVSVMAQQGMATPTYAYALNNPLKYTDPDGLAATAEQWCRENPATCKDLHLPPFDPSEPESCGGDLKPAGDDLSCSKLATAAYAGCIAKRPNRPYFCSGLAAAVWSVCMGYKIIRPPVRPN